MLAANGVITRDPEVLGGTPVFRGTRVPFQALLDYLEGGQTLLGPEMKRPSASTKRGDQEPTANNRP